MKKIWIIILFSVVFATISAQTHASADALFQAADYSAAQAEYGQLIKRYPTHALYLYRYARCAQELGDYATALKYFELSGNRYDLKHYNVGEIYMQLWQPEQAIAAYQQYLLCNNISEERQTHVQQQMAYAEKLQRYMRRVEQVEVIDTIEIAKDSLASVVNLSIEAGYLAFDTLGMFSYTNQREDRKLWVDSTQQIVSSRRLLDQWTEPNALPQEVNFAATQANPYMLNDGVTLYFAACDNNGLGGYDIFVTRYNTTTENYTNPENIGLPYNSPANDYFLVIDENQHIGYLASDRGAKSGYVRIYTFVPSVEKRYWRNISADSLAAYAQLKAYVPATRKEDTTIAPTIEDVHNTIFFVINDSIVYTQLEQFKSSEARKKFQELEQLQAVISQEQAQLEQLRYEYSQADTEERKKMAPIILQLEDKQSHSVEQCDQLIHAIRQLEYLQLQQ